MLKEDRFVTEWDAVGPRAPAHGVQWGFQLPGEARGAEFFDHDCMPARVEESLERRVLRAEWGVVKGEVSKSMAT